MLSRRIVPIQAPMAVVLVAVFPVLSLLSENFSEIDASSSLRSLAMSAGLSLILLGPGRCAFRDWNRAALWVCGGLLLFFSYGHIYDLVRGWSIAGVLLGRHRFLLPLWAIALAGWTWLIARRSLDLRRATQGALLIGAVLVGTPLVDITRQALVAARNTEIQMPSVSPEAGGSQDSLQPDIYYIILDGYGRADVLLDLYDFDNAHFIDALTSRGFYVAEEARSNYPHTRLSLASSSNMIYLDELAAAMGPESADKSPLMELIHHSAVRRDLEARGYRTVSFESGYGSTEIHDAAIFYPTPLTQMGEHLDAGVTLPAANEFEGILLQTTLLRPLLDSRIAGLNSLMGMLSYPYIKQRMRIEHVLSALPDVARLKGPKFVFAHVTAAHAPFVFGPNGESVANTGPFENQVAGNYTPQEFIQAYRDQVLYVNRMVIESIDGILASSAAPPIIILQADHGPEAYADYANPIEGNMRERFSILSAYYLPGSAAENLYPSITPVNTFRIIFNEYFGAEMDLLEDRSFFALNGQPYLLTDVTARAEGDG